MCLRVHETFPARRVKGDRSDAQGVAKPRGARAERPLPVRYTMNLNAQTVHTSPPGASPVRGAERRCAWFSSLWLFGLCRAAARRRGEGGSFARCSRALARLARGG